MARYTALFDACVLYPAQVRDLLLQLACTDTFTAKWSEDIQNEWIKAALRDQPHLDRKRLEGTRWKMEAAIPDALITGYHNLISEIELPDQDDRHVLAAAIVGRCDVIVTENLKDFPIETVRQYDIEVQTPDEFIANLFDLHADIVCMAARSIQERLIRPPISQSEYLSKLIDRGLAVTSGLLQASWDLAAPEPAAVIQIEHHRQKKST